MFTQRETSPHSPRQHVGHKISSEVTWAHRQNPRQPTETEAKFREKQRFNCNLYLFFFSSACAYCNVYLQRTCSSVCRQPHHSLLLPHHVDCAGENLRQLSCLREISKCHVYVILRFPEILGLTSSLYS